MRPADLLACLFVAGLHSLSLAPPIQRRILIDDLRARLLVAGLQALSIGTGIIPRVAVGEPVCRAVGTLWYASAPATRAAVRDNLRHVLGGEPSAQMVREVFVHGTLNYWDTLAITRLSDQQLRELVTLEGAEHIDAALAQGRGAILAGAHLGSIALVGQIIPALGYPTIGLLEPIKPRQVYDFFANQRQRFGMRLMPASTAAVRELLAALRRNEVLGLVTDRDIFESGPLVQFFDAPTQFADGPAALALRTGAALLPSVGIRRPDGSFVAIIEPPLSLPDTGDRKRDVVDLTQAVAKRLEYHIAHHPEQWTVFQKRWPTAARGSE
jgi:lauroyl/myristoyl acyltransferase